jgi:hypothetical protein
VNANSSILHGTELKIHMKNSNCSGFLGLAEGNLPILLPLMLSMLVDDYTLCV